MTRHAIDIHDSNLLQNPYPSTFIALCWASAALMLIVFCLTHVEWKFDIWTPRHERITMYRMPQDAYWWEFTSRGDEHELKKHVPKKNHLETYWDARHNV
jgi:hypothetical protein